MSVETRGPLDEVFRLALEELAEIATAVSTLIERVQKVRAMMPGHRALNPDQPE